MYKHTDVNPADIKQSCPLVPLTSQLFGFGLQLSLVIFGLAGNPFILIFLPVAPRDKQQNSYFTFTSCATMYLQVTDDQAGVIVEDY